jgi:hypothetical protein
MSTVTAVYCLPGQEVVMDDGSLHAQGQEYQQRTNGTGGDVPTGHRPCPFCHAVIPWESERCPSCGRVLVERVGRSPLQPPSTGSRAARQTPWWSASVAPVLARIQQTVRQIGRAWRGTRYAPRDSWSTTSRGASWPVFQPTRHRPRPWWLGSIPAPTERERQIVLIASALMVTLFLVALLVR